MIELLLIERMIHNMQGREDSTITIPKCIESLLSELPECCFVVETGKYRFVGFDILIESD